jgi:hypothetical protein
MDKMQIILYTDNWLIADCDSDNRQTRPLVREGATHEQDSNFQTRRNIWSWAPDGARHQDRLTDGQLQCDFDLRSDNQNTNPHDNLNLFLDYTVSQKKKKKKIRFLMNIGFIMNKLHLCYWKYYYHYYYIN